VGTLNDEDFEFFSQLTRARKNKNLDQLLKSFTPEELAKANSLLATEIAIQVDEVMLADEEIIEASMKEVEHNQTTWDAHKEWLVQEKILPDSAIEDTEKSTKRIAALLNNPELERLYGLVVGYVQSGKTGHFTGLMARAADEGITFVIVLSGILNDLRNQTQIRLMKDLIGDHHNSLPHISTIQTDGRKKWELLTSLENDVKAVTREEMPERMKNSLNGNRILVAVVKKNVTVLEHLLNGIKAAGDDICGMHRVLIIDDEADHATVNTGGDGDQEMYDPNLEHDDDDLNDTSETDPSRTNQIVRRIIRAFRRSAYIGYTATPFANVLIDEQLDDEVYGKSLYPRDFIVCMKRPDAYFGPKKFFANPDYPDEDSPFTTILSNESASKVHLLEIESNQEIESQIPISLQNAIMDFVLTGVARHVRRSKGISMNRHHTMLVHITRLNEDQDAYTSAIEELVEEWKQKSSMSFGDGKNFRLKLEKRWEEEFQGKNSSVEPWSDIEDELLKDEDEDGWIHSIEVRMINSISDKSLDYNEHPEGLNVIAIGGNKLSRGLTLEGLCVSFYLRETKLYDSLMQMGRWFGYRHGYEELVRVHTSERLLSWFEWLVKVEQSVRSDIARYALLGKSPKDLAVRIPLHSDMRPTARNKMQAAITTISEYSNQTVQSIHLPMDKVEHIEGNFSKSAALFAGLGTPSVEINTRTMCWKNIDHDLVADFIQSLQLPGPPYATFDTIGLAQYIRDKKKDYPKFIVAHAGSNWAKLRQVSGLEPDLKSDLTIKPKWVSRSQRSLADGSASNDVRAVSDPQDFANVNAVNEKAPAIIIYYIAPGSQPRQSAVNRMEVPHFSVPIVALALKFPRREGVEEEFHRVVSVKGIANR
jgi:hypothetical protein